MSALLKFSRLIDALNTLLGQAVYWLVLLAVLISAGNAVMRKAFDMSSNAYLEIQWYLFSVIFLLCAGYTLLKNEHVRIDIVTGRFSARTRAWIDIFGLVFFLFPTCYLFIDLGWPFVQTSFHQGEMSANPGGLIRWPIKLMVPVGFTLLALQGLSELIKRVAFLRGLIPDPLEKKQEKTAEQLLAEEIAAQARGAR
ncbi:MAG TPA: TRAP transporter small permease subunit [Rhodocyclaceae bacterium]|jgi:TRAP-type mannitol/chloroaromatic compound transport system permease small subunit|nr:TRAP transporter small permease subunit [Rhodocyclaceae bacterium]